MLRVISALLEKIHKSSNKDLILAIIVGVVLGSYYVYLIVSRDYHLQFSNDVYYYLGLADSLLNSGQLSNVTNIDSPGVVTPQNGLPVLMVFLKLVNFGNYEIINFITILYYALWTLAVYPFYKLIKIAGIKNKYTQSILVFAFLCGYNIISRQIKPTTDGIANFSIIFLVYFMYQNLYLHKNYNKKLLKIRWVLIFFISSLVVHFSIKILYVLGAFWLTLILINRKNNLKKIFLVSGQIILAFLSLFIPYNFVVNISGFSSKFSFYFSSFWDNLINIKPVIVSYITLVSYFSFMPEKYSHFELYIFLVIQSLIVIIFFSTIIYGIYVGLKNKKEFLLFISILVLANLIGYLFISLLLPSTISSFQRAVPRYMFGSLAFFYILAASFRWSRMFIFTVIFFSTFFLYYGMVFLNSIDYDDNVNKYLKERKLEMTHDTILSSFIFRQTYIWLGSPSKDNLCEVDISDKKKLWIAGPDEYQLEKKNQFLECHEVEIVDQLNLTPDYHDKENFSIMEYKFEKMK